MLHPSSLIRLAVWGSVALFVRAIVREANDVRPTPGLLPPPERAPKTRIARRSKAASSKRQ